MDQDKIIAEIENTPMLIHPPSLFVAGNTDTPIKLETLGDIADGGVLNGAAVVPVYGGLYHSRYTYYWSCSSYAGIRERFRAALNDSEVEIVVMHVSSGGGEVDGLFDLVDEIYEGRSQKQIISYIDETACSAAYILASAAHKVYIPRTGKAGSNGVLWMHRNISKAVKDAGIKYEYIYEGARKIDFSPYVPMTSEARAAQSENVKDVYDLLVKTVARNRGLTEEAIRNTEAGVFMGQKAVDIGLADAVMSNRQVREDFFNPQQKENYSMGLRTDLRNIFAGGHEDADLEKALSSFGYVPKESVEIPDTEAIKTEATAAGIEKGKTEATAAIQNTMSLCTEAKMPELAADLIGKSEDEVKAAIVSAQVDENQTITSSVSSMGSGEVDPVVAEMQSRYKS